MEINEQSIQAIARWLGAGSINIFGIQFAGKDSIGRPLAEMLRAPFISGGDLMRQVAPTINNEAMQSAVAASQNGFLAPTEQFQQLIVSRLESERHTNNPLILGSVGRWIGEEAVVINTLNQIGHPIKLVINLQITTEKVWGRWHQVRNTRNGGRRDDLTAELVQRRLDEFQTKTLPVIDKYRTLVPVLDIDASGVTADTLRTTINRLERIATSSGA